MPDASNRGFIFDGSEYSKISPRIISAILNFQDTTRLSGILRKKEWVLDYTVDDCGLCLAGHHNRKWLPRTSGIAHLYAPGTPYREDTRGLDAPIESRYIIFTGGELTGLDKFTGNKDGFARFHDPENLLGVLLYNIASSKQGTERSFWETQSIFYSIIELLHKHTAKMTATENSWAISSDKVRTEDEIFIEKVESFMSKNLSSYVELKNIARFLNVSPSTLSHKYRKLTGRSPLDSLLNMRINEAKTLLLRGEKLKAIAEKTGFYDEFHFSKTFRKRTGLPPRKFLRNSTAK
ncbi:MAG: helix-turn-helix transcriptional regulator [Victivallales bacterium]